MTDPSVVEPTSKIKWPTWRQWRESFDKDSLICLLCGLSLGQSLGKIFEALQ